MNILAFGAETKTNFTFVENLKFNTSQIYPDLKNIENYNLFENNIYKIVNNKKISLIGCDMHPDYLSTRLAEKILGKNKNIKLINIQHHFAHLVSVLYEHKIFDKVIGFIFDGTGYGTDNSIWGGEVMLANRIKFDRLYHLQYVSLPGGDKAIQEPWRMATAYLYNVYSDSTAAHCPGFVKRIGEKKIELVINMIKNNINTTLTSSMGRLFDAVAGLLGLCDYMKYEAEGAILLEKTADKNVLKTYPYFISKDEIVVNEMIKNIVADLKEKKQKSYIAACFINTLAKIIFDLGNKISEETGIDKIIISGGCFQNKYLKNRLKNYFKKSKIKIYENKKLSPTDSNISTGQAAILESYL